MMTLEERGIPRPPFNLRAQQLSYPDIVDQEFWSLVQDVYDYTELSVEAMFNLYSSVRYIQDAKIPGDIVECGAHMGGSVMLMEHLLLAAGPQRRLFALDTFSGFVRRSEEFDIDLETGADACPIEDTPVDFTGPSTENMESVGFKGLCIVKGDVLETIPELDIDELALLRLDTDTYDTTKFELEQLYDRVVPGGVIIVDDYGYTVGCKKAVDEFIKDKKILPKRIDPQVRSWVKLSN